MPAKLHPYIAKTLACTRVLKFKKRNSSTFEATPPSPGGPGPKIVFAYFFLGQGHDSLKFSVRNLEKNLGKKFPPGGLTPKIFGKVDVSPLG